MSAEQVQAIIDWLEDNLSHGSGIDCKWTFEAKTGKIVARNSYHCMDQNGYYDGYADFSLTIPLIHPLDFALHFHGKTDGYLARKYNIREYLEQTFSFDMAELQNAFDITVPCKRCNGTGHFAIENYVNPQYLAENNLKVGDDIQCWACHGSGKTA